MVLHEGNLWHAQEVTIHTLYEEPPSPLGQIRLSIKNSTRLIRLTVRRLSGSRRQVLSKYTTAALICSMIVASGLYHLYMVAHTTPVGLNDQERDLLSFKINQVVALDSLNASTVGLRLAEIGRSGDNIGGIDRNQKLVVEANNTITHVVEEGETLSGIAAQYQLQVGSILLKNPSLTNPELVQVGQILTIPTKDASPQELAKLTSQSTVSPKSVAASKPTPVISTATDSAVFSMPTQGYISQGYSAFHRGIDIANSIGTEIVAPKAGCLSDIRQGWNSGYGNMIILDHGNGYTTLYGHLSAFQLTQVGQCVEAGQVIGYMGSTGRSTGPHLHWEIRINGIQTNPLNNVR